MRPKDIQRHLIIGRAVARAVTMLPEEVLRAFFLADTDNAAWHFAKSIVRELHHSGYQLKDGDKQPMRPEDDFTPMARMAIEDYVKLALDLTDAGTRSILQSYDRRSQSKAIDQITETICNSFRVNRVVLERRKNPWDRG